MSGLVGLLNLDRAPVEHDLLQRLTDRLAFRGPDAQSLWSDGAVGLGHALLRTTDQAAFEQQPLTIDGQTWIVADGRLDARRHLLDRLKTRGLAPSDSARAPDVELLLRAYLAWGEDCLRFVLGDFCCVVWDSRRQTLFCARDQLGIKPLYYAQVGQAVVVSNTLNCVREHPLVSNRLNEETIGDLLLFGLNQNAGTTAFADIRKLPPGHILQVRGQLATQQRYWSLALPDPLRYRRSSEYVDHFTELLGQAVGDRVRTDKLLFMLSGGLDSTTVAATALDVARKRGRSLDALAYTMVFHNMLRDDERRFTDQVATFLGLPVEYLTLDPARLMEVWGKKEYQTPEPYLEYLTSINALSESASWRGQYHVLLSGLAADNGFYASFPSIVEMVRTGPLVDALVDSVRTARLGHRPAVGLNIRARLASFRAGQQQAAMSAYPTWLNPDFARRLNLRDRWEQVAAGRQFISRRSPRLPALHAYTSAHSLAEREWYDAHVSGLPLEVWFPFLDLRLIAFMLALPPWPWCDDKRLLRVTMRDRLPRAVLQRPKTAFRQNPVYSFLPRERVLQTLEQMPLVQAYVDLQAVAGQGADIAMGDFWQGPLPLRVLSLGNWLRLVP